MGSWRIGAIAGIDIKVHFTFPLILVWAAWEFGRGANVSFAIFGMVIILLFFACVLLHELGHALVARLFKIPVDQIILLPIGGVALLRITRDDALEEFLIAVAGPAVNLLIALALLPFFFLTSDIFNPIVLDHVAEQFNVSRWQAALLLMEQRGGGISLDATLIMLFFGNIMLALFNLLPVFPLDGGRAFRAMLALPLSYEWATIIAVRLGQLIALGLIYLGFRYSIGLLLIALFILWNSSGELRRLRFRQLLGSVEVRQYMDPNLSVAPNWSLQAVRLLMPVNESSAFTVLDQGKTVGLLSAQQMAEGMPSQRVSDVMEPDFRSIAPSDSLYKAQMQLYSEGQSALVVVEEGRLVGLLSQNAIERAFNELVAPKRPQPA